LRPGEGLELLLVFRPRGLRSAAVKAAVTLYGETLARGSTLVLLDLPRGLELLLARGLAPGEALKEAVERRLLPSSPSALSALEPVVEAAAKLSRELGIELTCYSDSSELVEEHALASEVARFTLRASITGVRDSDLDAWLGLIERRLELGSRSLGRTVDELGFHAARARKPLCLTGLEAWELARRLRKLGFKVELKSAGLPYLYAPLEVASRLASMGRLDRPLLKRLVEEHVNFVKAFAVRSSSVDEAYEAWLKAKAPWLPSHSAPSPSTY